MSEARWFLRTQDETFGPVSESQLLDWAKLGRIQPGQEVSDDEIVWRRVEDVPFLDMRFSIDLGDGNPRGPFNRAAAEALLASGRLPPTASMVEVRAPFDEEPAAPVAEEPAESSAGAEPVAGGDAGTPVDEVIEKKPEAAAAKETVREVRVEVPVEKIVEVPVEKVVEKEVIKEVRVEVPVEKVVEKVVVDETRVKELETALEEERLRVSELQGRLEDEIRRASEMSAAAAERETALQADIRERESATEKLKTEIQEREAAAAVLKANIQEREAAEAKLKAEMQTRDVEISKLTSALKDATDRENKYVEQVAHLEEELRRLPQTASEVADIQAAMFGIMSGEAGEIDRLLELEKAEFEEMKARYQKRADRLVEHRREILRRSGSNVEEMTRKALFERPEDPRTVQLRHELEELRRVHDRQMRDNEVTVRELSERIRVLTAESARRAAGEKDVTQLRQESELLREQLQRTEKELLDARQRNEGLSRQLETNKQALMARLASLESPSVGNAQTVETNQSREAKMVKLPGWMRLKH